jgi:hypothetical protein
MLLYASEVLPLNTASFTSFEFAINSVIAKVLNTRSNEVISYSRHAFDFVPIAQTIENRRRTFLKRLSRIENEFTAIWFIAES